MLGASYASPRRLARPSFLNWYQKNCAFLALFQGPLPPDPRTDMLCRRPFHARRRSCGVRCVKHQKRLLHARDTGREESSVYTPPCLPHPVKYLSDLEVVIELETSFRTFRRGVVAFRLVSFGSPFLGITRAHAVPGFVSVVGGVDDVASARPCGPAGCVAV